MYRRDGKSPSAVGSCKFRIAPRLSVTAANHREILAVMRANILHFFFFFAFLLALQNLLNPLHQQHPQQNSLVIFFIFVASVSTGLQINAWVMELHKIHDGFFVRFFYCCQPIFFVIVINIQVFRQSLTHWHTTFYNTWRTYIYIYIYIYIWSAYS